MDIKNIFYRDFIENVSEVYTKRYIALDFDAGVEKRFTHNIESYCVDITYRNSKTNKIRTAIKKFNAHWQDSYHKAVAFRTRKLAQMAKNENKI